jgi:hypothetical protein
VVNELLLSVCITYYSAYQANKSTFRKMQMADPCRSMREAGPLTTPKYITTHALKTSYIQRDITLNNITAPHTMFLTHSSVDRVMFYIVPAVAVKLQTSAQGFVIHIGVLLTDN